MGLTWSAIASFGGDVEDYGADIDWPYPYSWMPAYGRPSGIPEHPPNTVAANSHAMAYGRVYNTAGQILAYDHFDFWVGGLRNPTLFPDGSPVLDYTRVNNVRHLDVRGILK